MPTYIGVIVILLGAFQLFLPKAAWMITTGWKIKGAEPSEMSIIIYRIGGLLTIFAGIVISTNS